MEGDVERLRVGEAEDGLTAPVGREGVMDVTRALGRDGDSVESELAGMLFRLEGVCEKWREAERVLRMDPETEDAGRRDIGGAVSCFEGRVGGEGETGEFMLDVEFAGSRRGKVCAGAVTRRDPARDGMEVDILLAVIDGTGTGIAFGERAGVLSFEVTRTVVLVLKRLRLLVREALDDVRGLTKPEVEELRVEERVVDREKRVDVSDGAVDDLGCILKNLWLNVVQPRVVVVRLVTNLI